MLFGQDFHLFPCKSIELRDQKVSFAELSFKLNPIFEVLLKTQDSDGGVTSKEHDDIVFLYIFLLGKVEVAVQVDVFYST